MGITVIFFRKNIFQVFFLIFFNFVLGSKVCLTQKLENQSRYNPLSPKKC